MTGTEVPIPRVFPKILAAAGVALAVISIAYRHGQRPEAHMADMFLERCLIPLFQGKDADTKGLEEMPTELARIHTTYRQGQRWLQRGTPVVLEEWRTDADAFHGCGLTWLTPRDGELDIDTDHIIDDIVAWVDGEIAAGRVVDQSACAAPIFDYFRLVQFTTDKLPYVRFHMYSKTSGEGTDGMGMSVAETSTPGTGNC
jgi:hypothetical protein